MYLNCHSYYSLKYGTLSVKQLVELGQEQGVESMALTDINNTSGCVDFSREATKFGIKPVVGIDFRRGTDCHFIGLARSMEGFAELNAFLSSILHGEAVLEDEAPSFYGAYIIYPFRRAERLKRPLRHNEFIGVHAAELRRLALSPLLKLRRKMVVLHPLTYCNKRAFNMHRLLRSMDKNVLLSKLPPSEQASSMEQFTAVTDIKAAFKDFSDIMERTERLLSECFVDFEFGQLKNRQSYTGNREYDRVLLRREVFRGLKYRYPNAGETVRQRLEKELAQIDSQNFNAYFLINWDIVKYAQHKGYYYVGRGSGANSIVAYCLRITDVDPIDLDLYFERFINPYRTSPPDFDIDFSWKDRDDVIEYIFRRFSKGHPNRVALIATYSTLQIRALVRELGKVFGLPKVEIDQMLEGRQITNRPDKYYAYIRKYSEYLHGFPSHLSVHAGGILISERSMFNYTALSNPPKGFPLTQFSMIEAEDIGLYKFDILSQRGLSKIKDAIEIIRYNHPEDPPIDIHDMQRFKQDDKVRHLLKNGEAMGCFYVESPAMRMLLKKLRAETYLALVAASSIIRPGVAKSGMMREYILRFHHPERQHNTPKELLEIMPETFGIMVYQEDVIKVAHYFAGLTLGEADVLRRGMSGKFRSRGEFHKAKGKFLSNCIERGHDAKLTAEIWRQIESFAGYAFSKGHSASYAVESYQCLFLKAYYPLEYLVATINNFGGFYRTEYYIHEARMSGAVIKAPCVNNSFGPTVIDGKVIYLGFILVKDLEQKVIENIVGERSRNGPFAGLPDFIDRVDISVEQLRILIRAGAFGFTGESKQELLWEIHTYLGSKKKTNPRKELFTVHREFTLPELEEDVRLQAIDNFELLGFPLCSPFSLIDGALPAATANDIPSYKGRRILIAGYLVTIKNTGTSKGQRMHFGTFLDREGNWIDTVHFPPSAAAWPFRGKGCYILEGKVVEEFDFYTIEVDRMEKLKWNFVEMDARHSYTGG
ncbi:MAG: DNA polymerase III subunit alpha [Bacteroidetes bacterium]|nr:DNA polymerase III subunit alpha [Bacteroidota bacterium]